MAKIKVHEAEAQAEAERWQCESCEAPFDDRYEPYCMHCGMYWRDVENGLFDEPFGDELVLVSGPAW